MFNAALTTPAIDVVLPHCDAAERSRQREKSRHVRDLKECCSGDTQRRRNARFLPPGRPKSGVAARARRTMPAPAGTNRWGADRSVGTPGQISHPLRLLAPLVLPALVGVEQLLAQPDRARGDLDQFVVG